MYLHLRKRRYVCAECGKRFYENNHFLPHYYRATNRLAAKILSEFRSLRSAKDIGRDNNVSAATALSYFKLVNYTYTALPEERSTRV